MQSKLLKLLTPLLLSIVTLFLISQTVLAHENGPSYIFINGTYTILNPALALAHNPGFTLATDLAPEDSYLVGTPITFSIDQKIYFTPNNVPAEFRWNFQDETQIINGAEITHTFHQEGSYIIVVQARNSPSLPFSNTDIVQINIVSDKNYAAPKAKIMVNGKYIANYKDKQYIEHNKSVTFDASTSTGNNLRYFWEFGDGTRSKSSQVTHTYKGTGESTYFPLLRVVDEKNISNDSIISVTTSKPVQTNTPVQTNPISKFLSRIFQFIQNLFKRN